MIRFFLYFSVFFLSVYLLFSQEEQEKKDLKKQLIVERGFKRSLNSGFNVFLFTASPISYFVFSPYFGFSLNSFDFFASFLVYMLNLDHKKLKYYNSYIGGGLHWHMIDFAQLLKVEDYLSFTFGLALKVYFAVNSFEYIQTRSIIPIIFEPQVSFYLMSKKLGGINYYLKVNLVPLEALIISFDFGIHYLFLK